ncbi:hypothetical protein CPAST_c09160 [Clostridium pasteurianum DSM 525 = ATCC 6013]|uniref:Uncharacterized protein n=1 Tax=Clostridium pasteurianum DSM 525 = ATCC 6013 TaxID=1262449 RepID=A0A0H3IZP7_CLOPA|nr:hypothetical protein [Clostridium pasteurianum]AJA47016.1 hypothetical protein CPAST_c09160 [Clostridium pasteurianum DSM 525 = ATCC 6013]AJA51004.1 hypothetical protein CLPA_c09160 [Clostridium pasteurianum DSM 525 = ATCC 6013]AOZ74390.1 hypothetical protein AQ983_04445 [Clostridium pasteurianum DSM 525 = ATCC 6013]AOZ78187.1 hypothetical protein AQ984_04435 [Clostridium pasteurianum]ELP57475.1 hypothetical protein F502_19411 [Clostridium pasteurianum DSM 525 = ATCC 6013]
MAMNYFTIIITIFNFMVLFAIIIAIYKAIKAFRNFISRNKEIDRKLDVVLNKLENEEDR